MRKVNAVILCASAMSSGLIVDELKKVAPNFDIDISVECFASLRFKYYDYSNLDIVVLAPQIKSQGKDIGDFLTTKGYQIPIYNIPMRSYGLIKGDLILNEMLAIIDNAGGSSSCKEV